MASSVVVACQDAVVLCKDCRFTTDLGNCSGTSGACVVESATKAVFHHCTFETTIPGQLMTDSTLFMDIVQGPKVCVCAAPTWGRAVFDSCQGAEDCDVQGGCVAVV